MDVKRISIYLIIIVFVLGTGYAFFKQKQIPPKDQEEIISVKAEEKEIKQAENTDRSEEKVNSGEQAKPEKQVKPKEQSKPEEQIKPEQQVKSEQTAVAIQHFSPSWPLKGEIIKNYGLQYSELFADYRLHTGIDIEVDQDTQVKAAQPGKVILVEKTSEENIIIEIDHGEGWLTRYTHLNTASVQKGDQVKQNQVLGKIDNFMHFAIKQKEQWVNPLNYLK